MRWARYEKSGCREAPTIPPQSLYVCSRSSRPYKRSDNYRPERSPASHLSCIPSDEHPGLIGKMFQCQTPVLVDKGLSSAEVCRT